MAREKGYIVTVKMFLPVNPKSLEDTKAKADAIYQAQQSNDLSGLAEAGADVMKVDHRWTSREKAEAGIEHGSAETVEEIAEEAQEDEQDAADEAKADEFEEAAPKGRKKAA
jgi:hypothetical protein